MSVVVGALPDRDRIVFEYEASTSVLTIRQFSSANEESSVWIYTFDVDEFVDCLQHACREASNLDRAEKKEES